ncbi:MAG TPA: hypothetical protein VMI75_24700 [Polyangiaceae bacterium]|nr:hypothetical protein [Polyangiaceae bacterium]
MPKRTPEQVWRIAEKEAIDDELEFQRACNTSAADAEKELAAIGVDVAAERERAGEWRRQLEERVAARKRKEVVDRERVRSMRPERRARPAVLWLVAATVGAAVGGGIVYVTMHRQPAPSPAPAPAPTPSAEPEPVEPAPPQLVSAADLRRDAFGECEVHEWDACLADLDRARAMDPAGDEATEVKAARKRAIDGILANKPPKPTLKP